MPSRREVVIKALDFQCPSYVPWELGFTQEAHNRLVEYFGREDLSDELQNHFFGLSSSLDVFTDLGNDRYRDVFGVVWNRSVDKDIGIVENQVLPEPDLKDYRLPVSLSSEELNEMGDQAENHPDLFRVFSLGFSLYERAWTMRGLDTFLADFIEYPQFAENLLDAITDWNIEQVRKVLELDIDAVYFGDDWGQQHGLQMSPAMWRRFIKPCLRRMYEPVRNAGKYVMIHSCGKVDELFDDLVEVGVNCFNPFQPEVMDVSALKKKYHGRMAFHGGLSTQKTLPYGTVDDVRRETRKLIDAGRDGGLVFAPAHAVEGDVPLENMLAFIDELKSQPGFIL